MALLKCIFICLMCWWCRQLFADALECYTCDSAEDAECATKPGQQLNVEECLHANDECVTVIVAGITRRGCLSRLYPNKYCAAPCDRCSTSLCNRHVFPANRLRCYQCSGSTCIDVRGKSETLALPCPVYNEQDRCYTNVIGISNVLRGCEYTNLPSTCPHVCLKCNYNGCNDELGVHDESCVQCQHNANSPNPDCLRSQLPMPLTGAKCRITPLKQCTNKLLHGHRGKCFTYQNEQTGVVQRGCSTTMGFYPTGTLHECYGKHCNSECLSISCNNCSSTGVDGFRCRLGRNLRPVKCAADTVSCYACESGTALRRGCVDQQFELETTEACYECRDADGCNRTPVRTCYHCSTLDEPNCNHWSQQQSKIARQNCTGPDDLCVTTLLSKLNLVYTVRGCASQVPECTDNDPFCVRCNGSLCNSVQVTWQTQQRYSAQQQLLRLAGGARSAARSENSRSAFQLLLGILFFFLVSFVSAQHCNWQQI